MRPWQSGMRGAVLGIACPPAASWPITVPSVGPESEVLAAAPPPPGSLCLNHHAARGWEESGPSVLWVIGIQIPTGRGPEAPLNHPGPSGPRSVGPWRGGITL